IGGSLPYQTSVDTAMYSLNIAGTIATDPRGSVTLTGDQIAIVSGTVEAPGGTITLSGGTYAYANSTTGITALNGEGVRLTSTGALLAAGTQIAVPQSRGLAVLRRIDGRSGHGERRRHHSCSRLAHRCLRSFRLREPRGSWIGLNLLRTTLRTESRSDV